MDHRTIVFHFGGGRRKSVLQLMAAPEVLSVNEWLVVLSGVVSSKPDSLLRKGPGVLRLRIAEEIDRLERGLGRPFANRSLPLEVRVKEVDGWLGLDAEVSAFRDAVWSPPATEEVSRVLELIGRALVQDGG